MSKKIVGRATEKEKLEAALSSHRSELIAVYGRRRIGKTYLIREYFSKDIIFKISGLRNGTKPDQLENFMLQLRDISNAYQDETPKSWLLAFHLFEKYLKSLRVSKKKKVIFIDELPWVDTMRSGFMPAFENFWNSYCTTRTDLIVVVCGSAASYMIKKVLRNRGGLYNRITRQIKLEPFTLSEVKEFFAYKSIHLPDIEILKLYMVLGGIAEYLEYVKAGDSSVTAIDRICFQKGGQLEHEFDEVFKSLFEEGSYHEQIINALAKGQKKGMTRSGILEDKGISSGGQFTKSLRELIECGFVEKYEAHYNNRKTSLYRIFDEFCLFYLKFMVSHKGSRWSQLYTQNAYKVWSGHAFEMICYKHVDAIKRALKCDQIHSTNYSWSTKKAQVDLVIDRNDDMINLCEMKFYNDTFTVDADYAAKLRNRQNEYINETNTRKGVCTVLVTTYGVKGHHALGVVTNSITADSLFS